MSQAFHTFPFISVRFFKMLRQKVFSFGLVLILMLLHLFSTQAGAQGRLTDIGKGFRSLTETREITCVRKKLRPRVKVPMDLQVSDRLISDSRDLNVIVNCGNARLRLLAPFRLSFTKGVGKGCYIGYSSTGGGQLNVQASGPTSVTIGDAKLASPHTQYGIKMNRTRGGLTRQWLVYEGKVTVQTPKFSTTVNQGEKLVAKPSGPPIAQSITPQDFQQAARAYALADVTQMSPALGQAARKAAFLKLQTLHQAVLTDPKNDRNQQQLVTEQNKFGIPIAKLNEPLSKKANQLPRWNLTLKPNIKSRESFPVHNRTCKKARNFKVILENLPFVRLLSAAESSINVGETKTVEMEFDTTNMKPGVYQGATHTPCLDCEDDECRFNWVVTQQVILSIEDEQSGREITNAPSVKPAVTLPNKKIDQTQEPTTKATETSAKPPSLEPAKPPLEKPATKLEKKSDTRSDAGSETTPPEKSAGKPEVPAATKPDPAGNKSRKSRPEVKTWELTLAPATKTVKTLTVVNPCGKERKISIAPKNLPFVRSLSSTQISVKAGDAVGVDFEFDTNGIKDGDYNGRFVLTCLNCNDGGRCTPMPQVKGLKVTATDVLEVRVTITEGRK